MKKIFSTVASLLMLGFAMTSCVDDLNVESIDPNTKSSIEMNELFVKCYATLGLTGQKGPDGSGDVAGVDEGTSSFYRMMFSLNEYCADQVYWIWPDVGVDDIRKCTWTSSNSLVKGVYSRFYFDITLCNLFIDDYGAEAGPMKTAEIRFIRALNYFYLLDFFGNVPFVVQSGLQELPEQIMRPDLYVWLVDELESLEQDLAEVGTKEGYYRFDKAAAWLLLSRLCLNAEVYTGKTDCTADMQKAADYSKKVIDSSYDLASQYKYLFMGDNDNRSAVNDAYKEIIVPIAQDGIEIQSWGGSLFLIASSHTSGMPAWGSSEGWKCFRSRAQLIQLFCPEMNRPKEGKDYATCKANYGKYAGGPEQISAAAQDDRALFINCDTTTDYYCEFWRTRSGDDFFSGWSITKFSNLMADPLRSASDSKHPDMDIPLMRKAEAYLNYAEAVLRGATTVDGYSADEAINTLRRRAHATEKSGYELEDVLDERGREFYAEGMRRSDLIRFGKFTDKKYPWEYKGGQILGNNIEFEAYRTLFPLPSSETTANNNLKQNDGYN